MKKILILLMLLNVATSYSQHYEVTQNGLRNKEDLEKTFLILEASGKTANELYSNAIKYINENYSNPDKVIKGRTENEYLRFDTYVNPFGTVKNSGVTLTTNAKYSIELRFKDDRVRFEITQLEITVDGNHHVTYSGSIWSGYPIYNNKGEVRLPETKQQIEMYFNSKILGLSNYLKDTKTQDNEW